ncbi:MAG: protein-L-isoaspartate(D-aspartate) O-methyltransferase [Fuerstiella sp.]|nr:protein-L-isoaspartate(D-aspartate) O-methyltransferase [Fuerstiella sp.]
MVDEQIAARGVDNQRVLDTLRHVPRHKFVPDHFQHLAYHDSPLTIGHSQTISQPLIVAMMTQLANPTVESKALDVGTGSGYQAAVLSKIVKRVYSVEILEPLAVKARERLRSLEYNNIEIRCGDGCHGWPKEQPFDVIIVAAAPDHVPEPLIDQLAPGGILVIPVGPQHGQSLLVIEKQIDGSVRRRNVAPVTFVPMTGKALKETKNRD